MNKYAIITFSSGLLSRRDKFEIERVLLRYTEAVVGKQFTNLRGVKFIERSGDEVLSMCNSFGFAYKTGTDRGLKAYEFSTEKLEKNKCLFEAPDDESAILIFEAGEI